MRDGGVVEQQIAFGVASRSEAQLSINGFEEDVTALRAGELQSYIKQGEQNFVENAGRVELARGFQKDSELL